MPKPTALPQIFNIGVYRKAVNNMGKFIDLTGRKFGRLLVIKRVGATKSGGLLWECMCECGNSTIVSSPSLRNGLTKSCGCLLRERSKERQTTHGKTNSHLYSIWRSMKDRCYNKNNAYYAIYGAEGKDVCDEWKNDFQSFYDWAVSNGYKEGLSIDRIDNDKGYYPDNCRWVTPKVQMNNTRRNHFITYNGKTQTIAQWADELGIKQSTLYSRIIGYHWSIEKALTAK